MGPAGFVCLLAWGRKETLYKIRSVFIMFRFNQTKFNYVAIIMIRTAFRLLRYISEQTLFYFKLLDFTVLLLFSFHSFNVIKGLVFIRHQIINSSKHWNKFKHM
jgi:hypothetical protein